MHFNRDAFHDTVQVPNDYVTNKIKIYEYFTCIILVLQLSDAQYAQINMALPSGWDETIPDKQLKWQRLQMNEPFQVKLKNGLVSRDKRQRNNSP
jgi:Lipoprotein amino terminal region.